MSGLRRLWRGDLPLAEAFWTWAICIGVTVNLAALVLALILVTENLTVAALVVGHGLTLPYNVVATVGVWRSAGHHPGNRDWPNAARAIAVVLMVALTIL